MLQSADGSAEVVDENDGYWFVRVGAGADWTRFVDMTLEAGMQGLENLALIPGTAGGAVVQNIGAYGLEIAERVSDVECFDPAPGEPRLTIVTTATARVSLKRSGRISSFFR